jgi:hypothetical protein
MGLFRFLFRQPRKRYTGVVRFHRLGDRAWIWPHEALPEVIASAKTLRRARLQLNPGDRVEFELIETATGMEARHLRRYRATVRG